MPEVKFPNGKEFLSLSIPGARYAGTLVSAMHMPPAHSLDEALARADEILAARGVKDGRILAIPDGVSVMVLE